MNNLIIEKKANIFRERNGLSLDESVNLTSLLIKLGVNTAFKPLNENFSGMAVKSRQENFILVNTNQSVGRQNFTLAHELYHLFIQENFTFKVCTVGKFDKKLDIEEFYADLFAAFFLMPKSGIVELIPDKELEPKPSISLETIIKLEQYFQVSRRAILYRLWKLDFITKPLYDRYALSVIKSAQEYGYEVNLYNPTKEERFIGSYGLKAKKLYDSDKISEGDYATLMMGIGIDIFENENLEEND